MDTSFIDNNSKIWIGHYHECDIEKKSNDIGYNVTLSEITKYIYGRKGHKKNSLSMGPPMPDAARTDIESSAMYKSSRSAKRQRVSFIPAGSRSKEGSVALNSNGMPSSQSTSSSSSSSVSSNTFWDAKSVSADATPKRVERVLFSSNNKKTTSPPIAVVVETPPPLTTQPLQLRPVTASKLFGAKKPMCQSFIGTSHKLCELINCVQDHAKCCPGRFQHLSRQYSGKTLMLRYSAQCSLKNTCRFNGNKTVKVDEKGFFRWQSSSSVKIGDNLSMSSVDAKFALASTMTRVSRKAAESFTRAMQLKPPSRVMQRKVIRSHVRPYILAEKRRIEDRFCSELKNVPAQVWGADVGHNHSRNSEGATLALVNEGVVKMTLTDVVTQAWKKEPVLMKRGLDRLIIEEGLDIAVLAIDDNKGNHKMISELTRCNAVQPEVRTEPVQSPSDPFHYVKCSPKHAKKYAGKVEEGLLTLKKYSSQGTILLALQKTEASLMSNATNYFSSTMDVFTNKDVFHSDS